jgi:hypothetical protein
LPARTISQSGIDKAQSCGPASEDDEESRSG